MDDLTIKIALGLMNCITLVAIAIVGWAFRSVNKKIDDIKVDSEKAIALAKADADKDVSTLKVDVLQAIKDEERRRILAISDEETRRETAVRGIYTDINIKFGEIKIDLRGLREDIRTINGNS